MNFVIFARSVVVRRLKCWRFETSRLKMALESKSLQLWGFFFIIELDKSTWNTVKSTLPFLLIPFSWTDQSFDNEFDYCWLIHQFDWWEWRWKLTSAALAYAQNGGLLFIFFFEIWNSVKWTLLFLLPSFFMGRLTFWNIYSTNENGAKKQQRCLCLFNGGLGNFGCNLLTVSIQNGNLKFYKMNFVISTNFFVMVNLRLSSFVMSLVKTAVKRKSVELKLLTHYKRNLKFYKMNFVIRTDLICVSWLNLLQIWI